MPQPVTIQFDFRIWALVQPLVLSTPLVTEDAFDLVLQGMRTASCVHKGGRDLLKLAALRAERRHLVRTDAARLEGKLVNLTNTNSFGF